MGLARGRRRRRRRRRLLPTQGDPSTQTGRVGVSQRRRRSRHDLGARDDRQWGLFGRKSETKEASLGLLGVRGGLGGVNPLVVGHLGGTAATVAVAVAVVVVVATTGRPTTVHGAGWGRVAADDGGVELVGWYR